MKVRIGIVETERVVEMDVAKADEFEATVEDAFKGDTALLWFEDVKHRRMGIPRDKIAFVEIETEGTARTVGFSP